MGMTSVFEDNAKTFASIKAEQEFEKKAEKMLAGHRLPPNGRNFLAWVMRYHPQQKYVANFDETFKESPFTEEKRSEKFCPGCDKRRAWCECKKNRCTCPDEDASCPIHGAKYQEKR